MSKVFRPKFSSAKKAPSKKMDADADEQAPAPKPGYVRLQKVLANAGVTSRRNAEHLILEGKITVNGKTITELGTRVHPSNDKIKVNGKLILTQVEPIFIALYKPVGVISSLADPEGRPTLSDFLKRVGSRINPIGRLDFNSEGLILLTNDGDLANLIQKNRDLKKTYMIKIKGHPTPEEFDKIKKGIFTREGVLRFSSVDIDQKLKNKSWLKLEVSEGAKLDIKELFNRRGMMVDKIIRTEIGHITSSDLEPGDYKFLSKKDFERLAT